MRKKLLVLLLLFTLPVFAAFLANTFINRERFVAGILAQDFRLGRLKLKLAVVDTPAGRSKGLSGSEPILADEGMLFQYDELEDCAVWMPEMKYAIDVLWFDQDMKIIDTLPDLKPETYPNTYQPKAKCKYMLELPAGTIAKYDFNNQDYLKPRY